MTTHQESRERSIAEAEAKNAPVPAVQSQPEKPAKLPEHVSSLSQTKVGKISGAIAAVMGEIGIVTKQGTNQFHRYKYAQMQDILQQLTPLLAKHGLVIWQTETERSWLDGDRVVQVQYSFRISHSSGEVWPEPMLQTGVCRARDSKGGFDDKAINKCHTAARKYMLLALFQIPTGDVDDADKGEGRTHINKRVEGKPEYDDEIPYQDIPVGGKQPPRPQPEVLLPQPDTNPAAANSEPAESEGYLPVSDQTMVGSDLSFAELESIAKQEARQGKDVFQKFYRSRNPAEQAQLRGMKIELEELMKSQPKGEKTT